MTSRSALTVVGAVGLVSSIAALSVLLLMSIDMAARDLDRAAASQIQCATAMAVRDALMAGDPVALRASVERYHRSVEAEDALRSPTEDAERNQEKAEAHELSEAVAADKRARVDALVMQISKRELAEARAIANKMSALRHQTRMLALLLACLAALSTVVGAFGLVRSNRRLSRAVTERTAQIAAVDASRRLFFAKVSHELRTPVTVMRGEAEVALATRASNPDAPVAALREVIANTEFFGRRIEELLALSQAEDGRLAIVKTPIDIANVIRGAVEGASRFAISNHVSIKMGSIASIMIDGDARWLEQALLAVLDNAVKFSDDGGDVEVASARTSDNELLVTIADHGRGVAFEELPRLFDTYYQTESGRTRGGNGLGLALSRWIVEQHGGKVSASQRLGGGCQVEVRLPLAA